MNSRFPSCSSIKVSLASLGVVGRILDVAATSPDGQCVVLIDEYDKPILRHLARPDITAFRDELKPFYGVVYDTGATLAALLGLEPPFCWIGRPFDEALAPIPEK